MVGLGQQCVLERDMLRRRLVPFLVGTLFLGALVVPSAALATAGTPIAAMRAAAPCNDPQGCCPDSQPNCHIHDHAPGNGPGGTTNPGGGGGPQVCTWTGTVVPCSNALGVYVGDGCYMIKQVPAYFPPLTNDPNGQWYTKSCFLSKAMDAITLLSVWLVNPPANPVTPEQLARDALATIRLDPPAVGMAPNPNGAGLVGLPVWMWTDVNANTWGPIGASATDAGLTVTIKAQAKNIVWDMGNGDSVTCANPGQKYDGSAGASPACGYTYRVSSHNQPGGRYTITATTTWTVDWAGGGEAGVIVTTRTSNTTIEVDELQVVVG
jgi:hypothetical protein